jgi:hypothetical protein
LLPVAVCENLTSRANKPDAGLPLKLQAEISRTAERLAFLPPRQHLGNHFFNGHLGAVELQRILGGLERSGARFMSRASRASRSAKRVDILAEIPLEINCLYRRSARHWADAHK